MVGWMECLPFRDLSQIRTSFTRRPRYTIHGRGPFLPALCCRLTRERSQQHKSHTSTVLALGDQFSHRFYSRRLVYSDPGSLRCRLILRQIVLLHSRDTILVWPVVYGRSCFEIPM